MRARGFTLIELLVALTLSSFVMLIVSGALRLASNGVALVEQRADERSSLDAAARVFVHQLGQARAVELNEPGRTPHIAFSGNSHELTFVGPMRLSENRPGLYWMQFAINRHERSLTFRYSPFRREATAPSGDAIDLFIGFDSASFDYLASTNEADNEADVAWLGRWNEDKRLPVLVRLRIRLAGTAQSVDVIAGPKVRRRGI